MKGTGRTDLSVFEYQITNQVESAVVCPVVNISIPIVHSKVDHRVKPSKSLNDCRGFNDGIEPRIGTELVTGSLVVDPVLMQVPSCFRFW